LLENVKEVFYWESEGVGAGKSNSMGFVFNSGFSGANARLRREDCEFVKHDKLFSDWKVKQLQRFLYTELNSESSSSSPQRGFQLLFILVHIPDAPHSI